MHATFVRHFPRIGEACSIYSNIFVVNLTFFTVRCSSLIYSHAFNLSTSAFFILQSPAAELNDSSDSMTSLGDKLRKILVELVNNVLMSYILAHQRLPKHSRTFNFVKGIIDGRIGYNKFVQLLATTCLKMASDVSMGSYELNEGMRNQLLYLVGEEYIEDFQIELTRALQYVAVEYKNEYEVSSGSWYRGKE